MYLPGKGIFFCRNDGQQSPTYLANETSKALQQYNDFIPSRAIDCKVVDLTTDSRGLYGVLANLLPRNSADSGDHVDILLVAWVRGQNQSA